MAVAEDKTEKLALFDLEILKVLWTERCSSEGGGGGLTRKQIAQKLAGKLREDGRLLIPPGENDAALRVHLQSVIRHGTDIAKPRVVTRKAAGNKPGGKPTVYIIDVDGLITWPSTAYMLVSLESFRIGIERNKFIERMLQQRILNSSTNEIATQDEIDRQLATSERWGYIKFHNHTVMFASERLRFEFDYLGFVAAHLR